MGQKNIILLSSSGVGPRQLIKILKSECFDVQKSSLIDFQDLDVTCPQTAGLIVDVDSETHSLLPINRLRKLAETLPVIFLVSSSDISLAVKTTKMGFCYIYEKPVNLNVAESIIENIKHSERGDSVPFQKQLTEKEKKVLDYLLKGHTNKQIAALTSKSIRMVEEHRANIMSKIGADNPVDLIVRSLQAGFLETEEFPTEQNSRED